MNINELEELAKEATPHVGKVCDYMHEHYLREGHVDFENADLFIASERPNEDSAYYAAANPSAISELIAAYKGAIAVLVFANKELKEWNSCSSGEDFNSLQINKALATAKRLGIDQL